MTDISPAAKAAQESARTAGGQFGVQHHSAPEAMLAPASHIAAVDAVLTGRDDRPMTRAETRELMLAALAEYARENPALAIVTADGTNTTTGDVELLDLQYTSPNWDDGDSNDEIVERATVDLERLRANGMDRGRHGWDVRELMASRLDDDHGISEWFNEETHSIGGRFGDHVTVEVSFDDAAPVEVRSLDGELVSTHPTHDAARAARGGTRMTDLTPAAQAAQDAARQTNGRFGRQDHTAPEAELAVATSPSHCSAHLLTLLRKEAELKRQQKELEGVIVEEHIIDAARALPARARAVHYRVDPASEDGLKMLQLEFVSDDDGEDMEDLDPSLREYAYDLGYSFGIGDDLDYRNWVEEDETGEYVALRFDEDEADRLIEKYQADIDRDMADHGIVDPQLRRGKDVWLERSIRMRAADAGIARVHLNFARGAEGVDLTHFEDTHGVLRRPNSGDPDEAFILGRAQQFTRRTDGMRVLPNPDAGFTLDVR